MNRNCFFHGFWVCWSNHHVHMLCNWGSVDLCWVFTGACTSCPSSSTTMTMGIERVLKEKFGDALKDIRQVFDEEVKHITVEVSVWGYPFKKILSINYSIWYIKGFFFCRQWMLILIYWDQRSRTTEEVWKFYQLKGKTVLWSTLDLNRLEWELKQRLKKSSRTYLMLPLQARNCICKKHTKLLFVWAYFIL